MLRIRCAQPGLPFEADPKPASVRLRGVRSCAGIPSCAVPSDTPPVPTPEPGGDYSHKVPRAVSAPATPAPLHTGPQTPSASLPYIHSSTASSYPPYAFSQQQHTQQAHSRKHESAVCQAAQPSHPATLNCHAPFYQAACLRYLPIIKILTNSIPPRPFFLQEVLAPNGLAIPQHKEICKGFSTEIGMYFFGYSYIFSVVLFQHSG